MMDRQNTGKHPWGCTAPLWPHPDLLTGQIGPIPPGPPGILMIGSWLWLTHAVAPPRRSRSVRTHHHGQCSVVPCWLLYHLAALFPRVPPLPPASSAPWRTS